MTPFADVPDPPLIGIGDNCIDHYLPPIDRRFAGGNVLNVVANWLSHGVPARYAGSIGDDPDGGLIRSALQTLGDDGRYLQVVPGASTGVSTIAVTSEGEPLFVEEVYGVSGEPPLTPALLDYLRRVRPLVHLSTNGQALRVAQALADTGAELSCDFGYHLAEMAEAERRDLLARLDYAFLSAGDALSDEAVDALAASIAADGPRVVLVGRGALGVRGVFAGTQVSAPPWTAASPLDSLGAGDALIAGVLASITEGGSVARHLQRGLQWAAEACTHLGAFRLPTKKWGI
ncbi:MAG: PfkB family carbohydrate kinase [Clostridia bacterium]